MATIAGFAGTAVRASPLADRVLLKSIEAQDRTAEGLYIPDTVRERTHYGEIVAVGPGRYRNGSIVPMSVSVGDRVLYERSNGTEIVLDGVTYLILRERDLLAVLD